MNHNKKLLRLFAALAKEGLDVDKVGNVWRVRLDSADGIDAHVLLPDGFDVEGNALHQLATLAATRHPDGGHVCRACASPDFHKGDGGVAIGSVAEFDGIVVPAAVGSDIHCGMRLHVVDVAVDEFLAVKDRVVEEMKGQYFLGARDLPVSGGDFRALFRGGLPALLERWKNGAPRRGAFVHVDVGAFDVDKVFDGGTAGAGRDDWMPEGLKVDDDEFVRDDGLGTIGGGNHFVEVQVVDDVVDRGAAWALGVKRRQLAVMIHSGSRHIGKHVGGIFAHKAREAWPVGLAHPRGGLFAISSTTTPALFDDYLAAEAAAGHYAFFNRFCLQQMLHRVLRQHLGDIDMPLIADVPHNLTRFEDGRHVVRKGACPAQAGQTVVIPGSMGTSSFLCVGKGNDRFLSTASHGAGRARSRNDMSRVRDLGLDGVECVTPRPERRIEEAPAAYKDIGPVVAAQVEAGVVDVVARLRPLLTFKA